MLNNLQNYYVFQELVLNKTMTIHTKDINISNWLDYYEGIINILKDGIDLDEVHKYKITVDFGNGDIVKLSIFDLYFNIMLWFIVIRSGLELDGRALFFPKSITQKEIKKYLDKYIVLNRKRFSPIEINNIIDDTLFRFSDVDNFSFYLSGTINLKDNIELMNKIPEFNELLHISLENSRIEDVKDDGMKYTKRVIDIITNESEKVLGHEHCLKYAFDAEEGINQRQYKEFALHIGSKPDGSGGVHPHIIDTSYINAGLRHVVDQFVDSASSRVAQIQTKKNVGTSGNFARILGINNMDSYINPDPTYKCNTHNYQVFTVENEKFLQRIVGKYYKLDPDGIDYLVGPDDHFLIGTTILMYSPMTCASAAHGKGICYRCYGDLAYVNVNIKVGKIAAELLTSQLTQKQLSAKHLLETIVEKYHWSKSFNKFFGINVNKIFILPESNGAYILIDRNDIQSKSEDDYVVGMDSDDSGIDNDLDNFISEFIVIDKNNKQHLITSDERAEMFISPEFQKLILNSEINDEGYTVISFDSIFKESSELNLFYIQIINNDIGKSLKDIEGLINRKSSTLQYDKDQLLQKLVGLVIDSNLTIQSVHLETILMNQIRSPRDVLKKPEWENEEEEYTLLTLDQALKDNPSVVNSLIYQKLDYMLSYPLTFQKTDPSKMDLFFMPRPQDFIANYNPEKDPKKEMVTPLYIVPHKEDPENN